MTYELEESVQVLEPVVNVWRSATISAVNNKEQNNFVVNLSSTKIDIECPLGKLTRFH